MKKFLLFISAMLFFQIAFGQLKVTQSGNVGIGISNPMEKMQIGTIWTFHNGATKFIGRNIIYNPTLSKDVRIEDGFSSAIRFTQEGSISLKTGGTGQAGSLIDTERKNITLTADGNVGIGTQTPEHKLEVYGSGFIDAYNTCDWWRAFWTKVYTKNACAYHLWNNVYNRDVFFVCGAGYLWSLKGGYFGSDSSLKQNISAITNPITSIKLLNGVRYKFVEFENTDTLAGCSPSTPCDDGFRFGLIAQEVEQVLPEIVKEMPDGTKAITYTDLIAILIEGVKEQQVQLDSHDLQINEQQTQIEILQQIITAQEIDLTELRNELIALRADLERCCEGTILYRGDTLINYNDSTTGNNNTLDEPILYQNTPNPFNTNTQISYYLPTTVQTAYLYIYNLNGTQLKSYTLTQRGVQAITVYASELPAGMYLYTLVVDNEIIDNKRMILTK
ncbi:MAG TPA: tail fiber domain-containing protein [Bacteroidales bacterium]|nr:tail fiber domain-containing protein [Bacteroidales bacterium]HOR81040.1 tail fiber domain-containing protein [Bacteroidales bacterium]HPJ91095.1 tail fiber domain-containing protein [Bacteroidales bacterium]